MKKFKWFLSVLQVFSILFSLSTVTISTSADDLDLTSASELINLFDNENALIGAYYSASNTLVTNSAHCSSDFIPVTKGDVITFGPCLSTQGFHLHGYNDAKNVSDSTVGASRLTEVDSFGNYVIYSYTVPAGVTSVRMVNASKINDIYTVTKNQPFDTAVFAEYWSMGDRLEIFQEYGIYYPEKNDSVLYRKSALFVGDSISAATQETGIWYRGWAGRIGEINCMDYVNASVSGASCSTTRPTKRIAGQLIGNADREFDYVILHGGVNDAWDRRAVGVVSNGYDLADFDTYTFAGGLEEMIFQTLKNFPDASIGYIMNFKAPKCPKGTVSNMDEYFAVAKQICEKWKIPYLNLYEDEAFCNDVLKVNTTENLPDYIHPNTKGYDLLYPVIESWMETLTPVSENLAGDSTIEISTEAGLRAMGDHVTADFKLTNDIYLKNPWTPISNFYGNFDGNGFAIRDLYIKDAGTLNYGTVGLFGNLEAGSVVKNLAVYGTIENNYAAKIYVGGIVGQAKTGTVIENCFSDVNITFGSSSYNTYVGGIVGVVWPDVTVKDCINEGDITVDSDSTSARRHWIGGIAGYVQGSEEGDFLIENCVNRGAISVTKNCEADTYIAGIAGNISHEKGTVTITKCVNYGTITGATRYVAGIAGGHKSDLGSKEGKVHISYCSNFGEITSTNVVGTNYVGGIFGRGVWGVGSTVTNCYNAGKVTAPSRAYAGIAGDDLNVSCKNCVSVHVEDATGNGLFGFDYVLTDGCEKINSATVLADVVSKLNGTLETPVFKLENGAIAQTCHVFVTSQDTVNPPQDGGNNDQQGGNNDQQGGNSNETNVPETNVPVTNAPETNAPVFEETSGCKSVVSSALATVLCMGVAGVMIARKKD